MGLSILCASSALPPDARSPSAGHAPQRETGTFGCGDTSSAPRRTLRQPQKSSGGGSGRNLRRSAEPEATVGSRHSRRQDIEGRGKRTTKYGVDGQTLKGAPGADKPSVGNLGEIRQGDSSRLSRRPPIPADASGKLVNSSPAATGWCGNFVTIIRRIVSCLFSLAGGWQAPSPTSRGASSPLESLANHRCHRIVVNLDRHRSPKTRNGRG